MDQNPPPPAAPTEPPAPPPAATPPPPAVAPPPAPAASGNRVLAALGYPIWIISLVLVLIEKNDRDVKYHAWNALFWGIAFAIVMVALIVITIVLHDVPGIGRLLGLLSWALRLGWLVASIIFAVNAYNGKPVNIPVISDMARKQVGI